MKKCSLSLAIKKMQIKTILRFHFIPVRIASIKNTTNRCWQGCGEKGMLVNCWWECKLVQPLWKKLGSFLKHKLLIRKCFNFVVEYVGYDMYVGCGQNINILKCEYLTCIFSENK
jgi:hypothetical protein